MRPFTGVDVCKWDVTSPVTTNHTCKVNFFPVHATCMQNTTHHFHSVAPTKSVTDQIRHDPRKHTRNSQYENIWKWEKHCQAPVNRTSNDNDDQSFDFSLWWDAFNGEDFIQMILLAIAHWVGVELIVEKKKLFARGPKAKDKTNAQQRRIWTSNKRKKTRRQKPRRKTWKRNCYTLQHQSCWASCSVVFVADAWAVHACERE